MSVHLNFDQALQVFITIRQGDYYKKIFLVKINGEDYSWDGVEEIILVSKKNKESDPIITMKKSTGEIEITSGQMILNMPQILTNIEAGDYEFLEMQVIFTGDKQKTWWAGGMLTVLERVI